MLASLLLFTASTLACRSQGFDIKKILLARTCGVPIIENLMENITVRIGEKATFRCQVDLTCIVSTIRWFHEMENGTESIVKTAKSPGDPHIHIIRQVSPKDEGLYICQAANVMGEAKAAAYLQVDSANSSRSSRFLTCALISLLFLRWSKSQTFSTILWVSVSDSVSD